jgi:DNA polymerase-3 subunit delta'
LFDEVVGQPAAVEALRSAARLPVHAYLLLGPPGSGTRPAARAFGAALLCPRGGCGECTHCTRALAGTHPDLVTVERTGANLGIDEVRRLVNLAQRRPLEAARQVLVVGDVHLAARSAPALLKSVEEPPPATVFVLLAEDLPPELATVASRCVEVVFPPVPEPAIVQWLEARGVEPPRAAAVAEGAAGDLDRARLLVDDPGYAERLTLWRGVAEQLDDSGATAAMLAASLLASAESALEPLRAQHAAELEHLEEEAKSLKERGVPGRKEITDRHRREETRWRTEEIQAGMAVLARTYRDRMAAAIERGDTGTDSPAARCAKAVDMITEASASREHNPFEALLLQGLLVRLGALGA